MHWARLTQASAQGRTSGMPKRGYHHGNLRQALIDAALELITIKGPTGFTLSEAAKQAGVTPAAVSQILVHLKKRDLLKKQSA